MDKYFNHKDNDGRYVIGKGELKFEMMWSPGDGSAVHVYKDPPSIKGVALADNIARFTDIPDASIFNMSSRTRALQEGQIAVLKNNFGNYALVLVKDVQDMASGDSIDRLTFDYVINR